jgi:uncharacterized spore protein YtfJ
VPVTELVGDPVMVSDSVMVGDSIMMGVGCGNFPAQLHKNSESKSEMNFLIPASLRDDKDYQLLS